MSAMDIVEGVVKDVDRGFDVIFVPVGIVGGLCILAICCIVLSPFWLIGRISHFFVSRKSHIQETT